MGRFGNPVYFTSCDAGVFWDFHNFCYLYNKNQNKNNHG